MRFFHPKFDDAFTSYMDDPYMDDQLKKNM